MLNRVKDKLIEKGWIRFDAIGYWNRRYARGGDSGDGSKGRLAVFKADFINQFVQKNQIGHVIELGCGDGLQLQLAKYPRYTGYDISEVAIQYCREKFKDDPVKKFEVLTKGMDFSADYGQWDLALSLDVLYHIIDDTEFKNYLHTLFHLSSRYVILYAPDQHPEKQSNVHVRFRKFSTYIQQEFPEWTLTERIPNPFSSDYPAPGNSSSSEFFIYQRG